MAWILWSLWGTLSLMFVASLRRWKMRSNCLIKCAAQIWHLGTQLWVVSSLISACSVLGCFKFWMAELLEAWEGGASAPINFFIFKISSKIFMISLMYLNEIDLCIYTPTDIYVILIWFLYFQQNKQINNLCPYWSWRLATLEVSIESIRDVQRHDSCSLHENLRDRMDYNFVIVVAAKFSEIGYCCIGNWSPD